MCGRGWPATLRPEARASPDRERGATTSDCDVGDAPDQYDDADCSSVCSQVGSEWKCEIENFCTDRDAGGYIVSTYGSSGHDMVAFGYCGLVDDFCCTFDEDAGNVDVVSLYGYTYVDEPLAFTWERGTANEENLEPWDSDEIEAYIYGNDSTDYIHGSNHSSTDYQEHLYGQNGDDYMYGWRDRDYLNGGNGEDTIEGNRGADRIQGGCEDDDLDGGAGDDTLCDHSGILGVCPGDCNTADTTLITGGTGKDTLWYAAGANCGASNLDATNSDMGAEALEPCGDSDEWDTATEFPVGCDIFTAAKPAACSNP